MENQSSLSSPHFIVGPLSLKERIFSFCNPIQFFQLSKNRRDFLQACQNHDMGEIKRLGPKIGGLDWTVYYPVLEGQFSPLKMTIREKNVELIELLLKSGANPNFNGGLLFSINPYPVEVLRGSGNQTTPTDIQILKLLLDYGVRKQINQIWNGTQRKYFPEGFYNGNNLLHVAIKIGVPDSVIELLLQNGANPFIENRDSDDAFSLLKNRARYSTFNILNSYVDKSTLQKNLPQVQERAINENKPTRIKRL